MKPAGEVRTLDNLGRLTIPKKLRKNFNITEDTPLEIFADNSGIFIRKYETGCTFCGSEDNLTLYEKRFVCQKCILNLVKK